MKKGDFIKIAATGEIGRVLRVREHSCLIEFVDRTSWMPTRALEVF